VILTVLYRQWWHVLTDKDSRRNCQNMTSAKKDLSSLQPEDDAQLMRSVAEIVAAYVANNKVEASQIPGIIDSVRQALIANQLSAATAGQHGGSSSGRPAVPVRQSVTPSHITCLECGKPFQSLKRHLRVMHTLTPEEYRRKWHLPGDYPMVAPEYAVERSKLAKNQGLGTQPKQRGRKSSQA
jgi:predicted transcriptional regulator